MKKAFLGGLVVILCLTSLAFTLLPSNTNLDKNTSIVETAAPLTLLIRDQRAKSGQQVCMDVNVKDFRRILSMQYTLKWDRKVLKFQEVKGFNLPGMTVRNFGQNRVDMGLLTLSWYDQDLRGISLTDGQAIYQLCFEVTGNTGSVSSVQFDGKPTSIEITNTAGEFLELNGMSGTIRVLK